MEKKPNYQIWTLSTETVAVIKSTAPIIKSKGHTFATKLYELLFSKHEKLKVMFKESSGKLVSVLPTVLYDFAVNCDNEKALESTVSRIAHRHVTLGVHDWHYPLMEECFKETFRVVLADDATPAVMAAWDEGFKYLANLIMKGEDLARK